jgi:hypothetical protein
VKLRRADWPVVIGKLVDAIIAVAKDQRVRGAISVHEVDQGGSRHYAIVVRVPASETVAARSTAPQRK